MSQFVPLATSSPLTCADFTVAGPPGTVSFVWVACAAAPAARLRAPTITAEIRNVFNM